MTKKKNKKITKQKKRTTKNKDERRIPRAKEITNLQSKLKSYL